MTKYAALDVSMEQTAICVVDEDGRKIAEGKVPTDPDAIAAWLIGKAGGLARIGMETGPLAVWRSADCRSCVSMRATHVPPSP